MRHRPWLCMSLGFKLMRVSYQIVYGFWRLSKLPQPLVSIFGGSRILLKDAYAEQAHKIAGILTAAHISVVTGGGTGIMEAASCGAVGSKGAKGRAIGITVKDLGEGQNPCVQDHFQLDYFFARKWLMTRYSSAFIIFPGGFGTLDELAEVLTLIQTKKLPRVPIVLIGIEYWTPLMAWLKGEAFKHQLIDQDDLSLFVVTDDLKEVFRIIKNFCDRECPALKPEQKKDDR